MSLKKAVNAGVVVAVIATVSVAMGAAAAGAEPAQSLHAVHGAAATVNRPQSVGSPFTCPSEIDFLSQGIPDTQLYEGTFGSGSVTYKTLGSAQGVTYNALAYDPNNGYLYATNLDYPSQGSLGTPGTLYQIDDTGTATALGLISGYPTADDSPVGAFDGAGNYWITNGNGSTTAYEIDVNDSPPAVINTLTLTGTSWQPIDFSLDAGYVWGLSGTTIYRLDLSTGAVSTFSAPSGVTSGNYGAAWTFTNGNLGFSNNGNGDIYEISVANPASSSPTFGLVSSYTGPVAGISNDGASCIGSQPVDLAIVKTGPPVVAPSGTITWTLTVTNNGPGNSSGFSVSDAVPSGVTNVKTTTAGCTVSANHVLCSEGVLANGGTFTVTLTGTAPSTEGVCFTNTATVTGNETDPTAGNNTSSVQTCTTGISIVKSASISSYSSPGTPVVYSYLVTDIGTVKLNPVTVTDPMTGLSAITCPDTSLTPGQSETCTADYTTTQGDVDAGSITNTGTATGTAPDGSTVTDSSTVVVPAVRTPAITISKSASISSYSSAGTPVVYSYAVMNSGNVTLNPVTVTDPMTGLSAITCPDTSLTPGQSETCTADYTTTQGDVDAGSITNTGTATGTAPDGSTVTDSSTVTVPAVRTPAITISKSASISSYSSAGTPVVYSYAVMNSGNVTLNPVTVTDPMTGLSAITCPDTSLTPGQSETCTADYTTTQGDVAAGSITNTGTATGTAPDGSTVTDSSTVTVPFTVGPPSTIILAGGSPQTVMAGLPFKTALTAEVEDSFGNPISGASVTFTVTGGDASFPGGATAVTSTDSSGVATAPTLTSGLVPGPVTVTASTPTSGGTASVTYSLTVYAADWAGPAAKGLPNVSAGDAAGFYLGLVGGGKKDDNTWHLLTTQSGADPAAVYSGTITVDQGAFKNVRRVGFQPGDKVVVGAGGSSISFTIHNAGDLKGLDFLTPPLATTMTLTLEINGVAVKSSQVFLGPSLRHPKVASPLSISRVR